VLLGAARELFLRYGYREVSARQVADAAGVNPAMVQYYFGSKQGLYAAMLAEAVAPLASRIESMVAGPSGDELDLGGLLEAYMRTVAAHPWVPGLLMREVLAPDGAFRERFIADFAGRFAPKVAQLIGRAVDSGQARADLDPRLTLVSFLSLGLWPFLAMPVVSRVLGLEKSTAAVDRLIEHSVRLFEAGTAPEGTRP
jgi:AcrR family transcriptional regulator